MIFYVTCKDAQGVESRREELYPDHRAWLNASSDHDVRVLLSGPLLSDDESHVLGSHFILEATDKNAVIAFMNQDPFNRNKVWASIEVIRFKIRRCNLNPS